MAERDVFVRCQRRMKSAPFVTYGESGYILWKVSQKLNRPGFPGECFICELRLWQNEGRVSRRLPVTTSSDTGVELLPVEITPGEQKEPVAAIAPSLSTSTQTRVSASSCKVEFRHGNMTLENPSPELLTVLIRELSGRGR